MDCNISREPNHSALVPVLSSIAAPQRGLVLPMPSDPGPLVDLRYEKLGSGEHVNEAKLSFRLTWCSGLLLDSHAWQGREFKMSYVSRWLWRAWCLTLGVSCWPF